MKRVMIALLSLYIGAFAAAPTLITPPVTNLTTVEINWTAVPISSDFGIAQTIWLDSISFSTAGTARTVTVSDRQAAPVTVINAVALTANQVTVLALPAPGGLRMENGFTIVASGAGVVYQFRGRIRR